MLHDHEGCAARSTCGTIGCVSAFGGRRLGRLRRGSGLGRLVRRGRLSVRHAEPGQVGGAIEGGPGTAADATKAGTSAGGGPVAGSRATPLSWDLGSARTFRRTGGPDDDTAELPFRGVDLAFLTAAHAAPAPDPPAAHAVQPGPADVAHIWRLDPMAEQGPDLLSRLSERRLEIVALLGLTAGATLLSYLGLLLGFGLVAMSRLWDLRDKLLTLLVLPAATVFGGVVLAWLRATRIDPVADPSLRLDRAVDGITMTALALPLLVGWLGAAYLGYLLIRDADRSS